MHVINRRISDNMRLKDILSSMLFSQTVGIANNIVLPAPIVMFHVKLWLGGGGGRRREGEVGIVGAVVWALALQ